MSSNNYINFLNNSVNRNFRGNVVLFSFMLHVYIIIMTENSSEKNVLQYAQILYIY